MNKIIKRLSSYIDDNGNENNDINQDISDINYYEIMNARTDLDKLYNTKFEFFKKPIYKYTDNINNINIGLCGNSFINHNNDLIIIEFHIKRISNNIELKAYHDFDELCNSGKYSSQQQIKAEELFEQDKMNNYILGILLVFKNKKIIDYTWNFYNQLLSIQELKNIGNQLIQEYKQKYI